MEERVATAEVRRARPLQQQICQAEERRLGQLEAATARVADLQQQLAAATGQLATATGENAKLREEAARHRTTIVALQEELTRLVAARGRSGAGNNGEGADHRDDTSAEDRTTSFLGTDEY